MPTSSSFSRKFDAFHTSWGAADRSGVLFMERNREPVLCSHTRYSCVPSVNFTSISHRHPQALMAMISVCGRNRIRAAPSFWWLPFLVAITKYSFSLNFFTELPPWFFRLRPAKQIHNGCPLCGTPRLRNLVCFQALHFPLVCEEQNIMVRCCHKQMLHKSFSLVDVPQRFPAAFLCAVCVRRDAFHITPHAWWW